MAQFYESKKNVDWYEEMVKDYNPKEMIDRFKLHVPSGGTVLELGIGPGLDHDMLRKTYRMVGMDIADEFLRRYRARNPDADVRQADAETLEKFDDVTPFDAIYSNKVLQHLTEQGLVRSLERQAQLLRSGGMLFHCMWHGDKEDVIHGLRFRYYTEEKMRQLVPSSLLVSKFEKYEEMESGDSFYIVLQKM